MPTKGKLVLIDSVTEVEERHAGRVVATGSHGGVSSARYALGVAARLYVFNDAGVGRDNAGIAALDVLEQAGIAAVAVSHESARIGEALDTFERGIVSSANEAARTKGCKIGATIRELVASIDKCGS